MFAKIVGRINFRKIQSIGDRGLKLHLKEIGRFQMKFGTIEIGI